MLLGIPARRRVLVLLVQHEPLLLAALLPRPDEHEHAAELLPEQLGMDVPVRDRGERVLGLVQLPGAAVPHDHVAAAVLPARDDALEVEVVDRVVLDVDREVAGLGIQGRTLRHGPADEHAVHLEAEVVVQPPGPVPLHDEARRFARRGGASACLRARSSSRSRAWLGTCPGSRTPVYQLPDGSSCPRSQTSLSPMVQGWTPRRTGACAVTDTTVIDPEALLAEILLTPEGKADPNPRYAAIREHAAGLPHQHGLRRPQPVRGLPARSCATRASARASRGRSGSSTT